MPLNSKKVNVVHTIVGSLFADMLNPINRGSKFTWNLFPNMAKGIVEANFFLHFNRSPSKKDIEAAGDEAHRLASNWVHRANLIDNSQ